MNPTHARLNQLVRRAQCGDVEAFGQVVAATRSLACAVAMGVLRDPGLAQDAAQDAYLRAFRRLGDLEDPAGFVIWFRRVVITVALNLRRSTDAQRCAGMHRPSNAVALSSRAASPARR